jgi:hypothetical protein
MNPTLHLLIFKAEQKVLQSQTERGRQRAEAIRQCARCSRGGLSAMLDRLSELVLPHRRSTLERVKPGTPHGAGGSIALDGVAGR